MKNDRVIIFGAGADGAFALDRIGKKRIECFVDNDIDKQGTIIHGKQVISFEELCEKNKACSRKIIVSSQKYFSEMIRQLKTAGIECVYSVSRFLVEEAFKNSPIKNRIILMNTHAGINIGDQAITEGEYLFFCKYLPDFAIVELSADLVNDELSYICELVADSDIIAVSGGGYMGSLWNSYGEDNVRDIVRSFSNNRIFILPQSIFFENSSRGEEEYQLSKEVYKRHNKLKIYARECESYRKAKALLGSDDKVTLMPDMALILNGLDCSNERAGVGICIRNDKESILADDFAEKIKRSIRSNYASFDMLTDKYICIKDRKKIVESMMAKVSGFKYVITDRLHCMILCVITGTPCIAFDNLTGKVCGVYQWIKNNPFIHVVKTLEEAEPLIEHYEKDTTIYRYDRSFVSAHYSKLADMFLQN